MFMTLLRKFTVIVLALTLCLTTVACGGGGNRTTPQARNNITQTAPTRLNDGQYPVQQASYDDANGEYTLFLLNSPTPTFRAQNLQMARLTDEEIKQGQKSYLKVENGQPVLYLTEDFKIEYVHNVAETRTNPQTGQQETVVTRRESGFWAPFAGALAGQAIGSLLFRPHYYVPPAYQPGGSLITGYGGYGRSYGDAIANYQTRYNSPPAEVRNRTTFRSTGTIRRSYPDNLTTRTLPPRTTNRPTGSGFGSSILRPSGNSSSLRRPSGSSFGSGGRSRVPRSSGFGSRRR